MAVQSGFDNLQQADGNESSDSGFVSPRLRKIETTEDAVDKSAKYALIFVAGWIACSAYYKIPELWHAKNLVPKLADVAGCQTVRANELQLRLANANIDTSDVPNCPTPPKVKTTLAPKK